MGFADTISRVVSKAPQQAGLTDAERQQDQAEIDSPTYDSPQDMRDKNSPKVQALMNGSAPAAGGFAQSIQSAMNAPLAANPKQVKAANVSAAETPKNALIPSEKKVMDTSFIGQTAANLATGIGSSILGGYHGLATLATGGTLDDAANAVREAQAKGTYQPPEGSAGAKAVEALASPFNPLNWIGIAGKKAGEFAQDLGASPGVATAIETGINAAPMVIPAIAAKMKGGEVAPKPTVGEVKQTVNVPISENLDIPTYIRKRAANDAAVSQNNVTPISQIAKEPRPVVSEPISTKSAGGVQEALKATAALDKENAFQVSPAAQAERAAVLKRIGLENATDATIKGNTLRRATEGQMQRFNEPAGEAARAQFAAERQALTNHADSIIKNTGGTAGMDEIAQSSRGNTILQPLQDLKGYFDAQTKKLYADADAAGSSSPTSMPKLHEIISGDKADFLGTVEGEQLLKGINARMKSLGMVDAEGNPLPVTAKVAERLRQYVGDQWTPRTSRLIRQLKNVIDDDALSGAGENIYKQARAVRSMRSQVFENEITDAQGRIIPNPLAKIVDASGKQLELLKSPKDIPNTLASMPVDQLRNVMTQLDNVPPEIQPAAAAAKAEIKAHFANKIADIGQKTQGQWDAVGVSKFLKDNAAKVRAVFTEKELAALKDLNDAGHILRYEASYPGAAAQAQNAMKSGLMSSMIRPAAAAIGSGVGTAILPGAGSALGAAIGDAAGVKAAVRSGEAAALRRYQKNFVNLKDVARP